MFAHSSRLHVLVAPIVAVALASCGGQSEPFAAAYVMETLDQGVGGPKADARPGDFIIENDHFKVAVLSGRNSLGPGLFGGGIIDADIQRPDLSSRHGNGNDQLAEIFPTVNMNVTLATSEDSVQVVSAGGGNKPAVVRVQGEAFPFITLLDALWALVQAPDIMMSTDYIAEPGVPWLTMKTTATFWSEEALTDGEPATSYDDGMPLIEVAMETGAAFGEFYLQGGSVDVFAPGMGFDEDGHVYKVNEEGKNTFIEPFQFDFLAGVADGVSYGIAAKEGALYVPLFTSSQTVAVGGGTVGTAPTGRFTPGSAISYERYLFIGHGDIGSIVDQYVEARGIDHGTVTGHVIEDQTGDALSGVSVFVYKPGEELPWSQWETDVHPYDDTPDGSFGGRLPVGEWDLVVHQHGRGTTKKFRIDVKKGKDTAVHLSAPPPGALRFTIRDERGRTLPAKLTIVRDKGESARNPDLGDGFIGGDPEAVIFSTYGTGEVLLPPGRYRAIASRGLEYEIHESKPFEITAGTGAEIELQVIRSLDTPGWISADFHVHSVPSHDSGVHLEERVTTMVAEGVEFFSSTDHDHITDFAPTVEAMGLQEYVQTAVGNEVTTIEIGHFLSFPLQHDFLGDHGADKPERIDWTDKAPATLISDIKRVGKDAGFDPVVFVGHPRDGILGYFDQYGFNPYEGNPGFGGQPGTVQIDTPLLAATNSLLSRPNFTTEFDAMEIFNGKRLDFLRTPTQPEMDDYAAGGPTGIYDWMERTLEEQDQLDQGVYQLGYEFHGVVDDWFALLNLGFTYTALGNSDTHGKTSVESGCPRNYVISTTDDPMLVDDQEIADAIKNHKVVASYGPFIEFTANGNQIGETLEGSGPIDLSIKVSAPTWIPVDRVELYQNGVLIQEWDIGEGVDDILRLDEELTVEPDRDSWFVVIAMADGDLYPVFTPVEMPPIELDTVVTEALVGVDAVASLIEPGAPIPQVHPVKPYAMTNPIWIDQAGDGFDAPGHPSFWREPVNPADL